MSDRQYYSQRYNLHKNEPYSLGELKLLFVQVYYELSQEGYFEELIGYHNSFGNWVNGKKGNDLDSFVFLRIGKSGLVPIDEDTRYKEDDIFDLIELFYDYVSFSEETKYGRSFDAEKGKKYFRERINKILGNYKEGFELSPQGYIREILSNGLDSLVDDVQELDDDDKNPTEIIDDAKKKFFHYNATTSDKKAAIIELGGVLELFKTDLDKHFNNKDESDLFNLLNNYNLRHKNLNQKNNYDIEVFYPWIFFNLLAAIDACFKMINRE
ncbi:hypothetical protein AF332_20065 [Sporosarcina globispora]|uniref:Uncharacterized protein n=1 Tax=Sporosarcina globispora TaxID=1459 RepID=A0A0M0GHA6_SPOGL|nr:hypothetical protein [Sporosarcina globispora]KON88867.1 hypothetical protein AF332_20065 [Sporosarcina globispora]